MKRMLTSMIVLAAMSGVARAQSAPVVPPTSGTADQAKPGGDTANDQTYKMKDGGMYQPPAQRPASPAMDRSGYGRT